MPQGPLTANVATVTNPTTGVTSYRPLEIDPATGGLLSYTAKEAPAPIASSPVIANGTITNTGTFQSAAAANTSRYAGGAIVNHGTAAMNVTFAPVGNVNNSAVIPPNTTFAMSTVFGNLAYTGPIQITGTAGDVFTVLQNTRSASS